MWDCFGHIRTAKIKQDQSRALYPEQAVTKTSPCTTHLLYVKRGLDLRHILINVFGEVVQINLLPDLPRHFGNGIGNSLYMLVEVRNSRLRSGGCRGQESILLTSPLPRPFSSGREGYAARGADLQGWPWKGEALIWVAACFHAGGNGWSSQNMA